jgi:hypothetical protein
VSEVRTIIEFNIGTTIARTVSLNHNIPAEVGHTLSFDHPSMKECISGTVTRISHVVFLDATALTYIDVAVQGMGSEAISDQRLSDIVDNIPNELNANPNDEPFGESPYFYPPNYGLKGSPNKQQGE